MEIREFTVNGKKVQFVNNSRGTRSGFAHDTTLFINGCREAEHTCHYLNRTWECYTYQTVMRCAVHDLIERETAYLKERFMEAHEYKKLTAPRKAEFEAECKKNADLIFYEAILTKLRG